MITLIQLIVDLRVICLDSCYIHFIFSVTCKIDYSLYIYVDIIMITTILGVHDAISPLSTHMVQTEM